MNTKYLNILIRKRSELIQKNKWLSLFKNNDSTLIKKIEENQKKIFVYDFGIASLKQNRSIFKTNREVLDFMENKQTNSQNIKVLEFHSNYK